MEIKLNECPRPNLVRKSWTSLNGKWDFIFDKDNVGHSLNYQNGFKKRYEVIVPFSYQTKLSGINIEKRFDHIWYQKKINIKSLNKHYILHLEGSDWFTEIYVNGKKVREEVGGYHRISTDITDALHVGNNLIVIYCNDDYSVEKPRGKQRYKDENFECWYVDTNGLYKEVWLEQVNETFIKDIRITPDVDNKCVTFETYLNKEAEGRLKFNITFNNEKVVNKSCKIIGNFKKCKVALGNDIKLWDVTNPNLYEVKIKLVANKCRLDECNSYFGMRKVETKNGFVYLNDKKFFQKLVLDQGYWPESGLTAPSNEALLFDITKMKEYGFNGARKHQKVEDERFLYYADVLGYVVWSEGPSMYKNTKNSRETFEKEWLLMQKQQYNHPSVITWTPFNESWGIQGILTNKTIQGFVNRVVRATKKFDKTRFVISNDGWEHTHSDLITMHHYEQDPDKLKYYYNSISKCTEEVWEKHHARAFANGYKYQGEPLLVSEFGGTAFIADAQNKAWGYGVGVKDGKEYGERVSGLMKKLSELPHIAGYCYTQVSDVEQEVNGLLTADRKDKINPKIIADIQNSIK